VRIHKFASTDAFVAIDLEGAEVSSGPVRSARKVLQASAADLARSQTYTYAVLGMQRGGASAGISADGPDRAAAVEAFVTEAAALVADGTYLPDAAKGVDEADLAPLRTADPRDTARGGGVPPTTVDRATGLGVAVCADATVGLEGRTVAIEGFSVTSVALAAEVVERGGRVIAVATGQGSATAPAGFDPVALADAWSATGDAMVDHFGDRADPMAVFDAGADVVVAGSKMGVIDHTVAERIGAAAAVVAGDRLPLTARALAVLRRAGTAVPGDFVALAGATLALWGDANRTEAEVLAGVVEEIGDLSRQFGEHEDGPFLAACFSAEAFLSTWQESLPFGRPLAP
jgi:glutamate dehydrogenase/leucine dehydrogenase